MRGEANIQQFSPASSAPKKDDMDYISRINALLQPRPDDGPLAVDLFAGCGGLALGFEAQGFRTHGFEMEQDCCVTYEKNLHGQCDNVFLTPETPLPQAPVIIGGPPCQPFSVGGKQMGHKDERNGFPAFIGAVRNLKPEIWLMENVRGLFYKNRWYLDEVVNALKELDYIVEPPRLINAVDYGVPQNRERVIVVGHRGRFNFPAPQKGKITAGEALGDLAFSTPENAKFLTSSQDTYIANYEKASCCITPRDLHLDRPSRTLTCRNLAGATGDMMRIRLPDGRRRRITAREAARLQSFPDWFEFTGTESSQFYQIGNAVPPMLSFCLANAVRSYLESNFRYSIKEIRQINRESLFDFIPVGEAVNDCCA